MAHRTSHGATTAARTRGCRTGCRAVGESRRGAPPPTADCSSRCRGTRTTGRDSRRSRRAPSSAPWEASSSVSAGTGMRAVRATAIVVTTYCLGDVRAQRPVRARAVDADEYTVVEHRPRRILRRALGARAVARPCTESLPAPLLLVPRELRHRDRLWPLAKSQRHPAAPATGHHELANRAPAIAATKTKTRGHQNLASLRSNCQPAGWSARRERSGPFSRSRARCAGEYVAFAARRQPERRTR